MEDNVIKMDDPAERTALLDRLQKAIESVVPETVAWCLSIYGMNDDETTFIRTHHRNPHPAHVYFIGQQIAQLDQYYANMFWQFHRLGADSINRT